MKMSIKVNAKKGISYFVYILLSSLNIKSYLLTLKGKIQIVIHVYLKSNAKTISIELKRFEILSNSLFC